MLLVSRQRVVSRKPRMIVDDALERLEQYLERVGYCGYDCYDALRSPLLKAMTRPSRWLRIAAIQLLKKSPINLRPLLFLPKGFNPKGLGLFLSGACRMYRLTGAQKYLKNIDFFDTLLLQFASKGYSGMCWGYNFDWQSRVFYLPAFTPTIVNSSFVAHAYLDAYEATGRSVFLDNARSTCSFIMKDLHRTVEHEGISFSYTPIDRLKVHNANILGAGLLARVYRQTQENDLRELALQSAEYVIHYQRADGSWRYAETDIQDWVDSFHTGFVLESLSRVAEHTDAPNLQESIRKGYRYFLDNFFLDDGTPKYYDREIYPIDIHSAAQAIVTIIRLHDLDSRSTPVLGRVTEWTLQNMQSPHGFFYFQKHRHYTNTIPYIRWSQAWMYYALTIHKEFHTSARS